MAGSRRRGRRPALRPARGRRRRRRGRPGAGQQAGREGPEKGGDAGLPAALPALAAVLPQPRRLGPAADDRRPGDRRHLPHPPSRQRGRLDLDLRPQPDHGVGSGTGDRLQPLHRLPLSRGDRQERPRPARDAAGPGDLRAHRLLLLPDRRRRARLAARLPAALPLLDGPGRGAGGAVRGADLADRAAGGADPPRHPGQRRCAEVPAAPRRGRCRGRRERLLVPTLALRDAPAVAGGDLQRPAADRHGPALPRDQVQHRRPDRAAGLGQRPPGLRPGQQRIPPLPRDPDLDRRRRRRRTGGRGGGGAGRARPRHRRSAAAAATARRRHRDPGDLRQPLRLRGQPGDREAGPRAARRRRARRRWSAAPRPTSSTSRAASPSTCRSCWRSSSSPPWSSSS